MINKKEEDGKTFVFGFHTQESRDTELTEPIICEQDRAWLGRGYYFWLEKKFAHFWGKDSKTETGSYDIYTCWIENDHLINASFSEEGYFFWKDRIEKTIDKLKESGFDVSLSMVHEFLAENVWDKFEIKGIIFDDIPQNPRRKPERIYSEIPPLYYEKRIQLAIFDIDLISNFETFCRDESCIQ